MVYHSDDLLQFYIHLVKQLSLRFFVISNWKTTASKRSLMRNSAINKGEMQLLVRKQIGLLLPRGEKKKLEN